MASNNQGSPQRISKAYLFGLSDKPYREKAPPATRQSRLNELMTRPGAMIEYIASDGRKGKLTGSNRPEQIEQINSMQADTKRATKFDSNLPEITRNSLTAANLAMLPSEKLLQKTPSTTAEANEPMREPIWDAFPGAVAMDTPAKQAPDAAGGDGAANNAKGTAAINVADGDNPFAFTTAEDAELLRGKTENETWEEIVAGMGRQKNQVTRRFGQIKPKGWKPKPKEKGGKGKQENDKGQGAGGGGGRDNLGGDENGGGAAGGSNRRGDKRQGVDKAGGHGGGHGRGNGNGNGPPDNVLRDVYPDDDFSMDDLVLLTKLLKRDQDQAWFRVACAFRDRTGRRVSEDAVREKFQGGGT